MAALSRIIITLPPDHGDEEADTLLALLALRVSHGWEEESLPTGEAQYIVHSSVADFCAELAALTAAALPRASVVQTLEEEVDWVEAWKEFFTPVEGGSHFLVLAPWMEEEQATGRIPIIIEPKSAFGTGHHATTALCLGAISALRSMGVLHPGMRFLDLGTGSGILGLACAKLGLTGQGLDIDVAAVDNALENRAANGIPDDRFMISRGGIEAAEGSFDLILANILAEPLKDLAPDIAALKDSQGGRPVLVLSGLLAIQADAVEAAYTALGYAPARRMAEGEWAALIFA